MRCILLIFAFCFLVGCSFSPTQSDLQDRLAELSSEFEVSSGELLHARGRDYGPQSGFDVCFVLSFEEDDFVELVERIVSNGKKGVSGVYEQNSVCKFTDMANRFDLNILSAAYSVQGRDGTKLDVIYNEDRRIMLFFFWRT